MPQIVSLLPTAPAMPAAAPAAPSTPATAAGAPGPVLPPDLTSPNFLAQFKAALKTIANVVVQPPLTPRTATDPSVGPLMSPVSDDSSPPATPSAADADKLAADLMPALLAELGFAIVPPVLPVPTTPTLVATGAGPAAALPERVAQVQLPQVPQMPKAVGPVLAQPRPTPGPVILQASAGPAPARSDAPVAQALPTPEALPKAPVAQAQALLSAPTSRALPDATLEQALAQAGLTSAPVAPRPIENLKLSDLPQAPAPTLTPQAPVAPAAEMSATVMLPPTAAVHLLTPAASAPPIGLPQPQSAPGGGESGDARGDDHGRHAPNKVASISSTDTTTAYVAPSDAALAAAAATAAPATASPLPVPVTPSQVVSQIAQHADVIKLPGNRGLRIELHPDDLGGVQVTVRYAPGGGVELHINAEHAATGALVQAGWTELRDALASHGISADRLMLSVTAPTGGGQADLSGGGGSRSDPNYASSSQGGQGNLSSLDSQGQGQGQSAQDNAPRRTSPNWNGGLEPVASPDDNPRVASTTAAPSRIDYRV